MYVSGHGITEEILRKACTEIGSIININVEPDKNCGFVTFENMEDADTAVNEVKYLQLINFLSNKSKYYNLSFSFAGKW